MPGDDPARKFVVVRAEVLQDERTGHRWLYPRVERKLLVFWDADVELLVPVRPNGHHGLRRGGVSAEAVGHNLKEERASE